VRSPYILAAALWTAYKWSVRSDELGLPVTESGLVLPCGASGRWESGER
ncbi:SAM-dependent methyltransferase, partial [[Clostridium] symbiosum]|nr:SAM-dependent methyltransferase [[Clostridium] symbiosum]